MVTKATRDVISLSVREITGGIKVAGDNGANFSINGTPIGLTNPGDGAFVNLSAQNLTVTGTLVGFGGLVPIGGIIMYNGSFAAIPTNWQLCDGTNGTPDMTDKFVYGTNTEGQLLDSGGSADAVNVAHTHTASSANAGNHRHKVPTGSTSGNDDNIVDEGDNPNTTNVYTDYQGNHNHTITVNSSGVSGTGKNIPPYAKLAFIQRMS